MLKGRCFADYNAQIITYLRQAAPQADSHTQLNSKGYVGNKGKMSR